MTAHEPHALGWPIKVAVFTAKQFGLLVREAGVKRISFHGLRHSSASIALAAGEPVANVAKRLGHANAGITWKVYAHAVDSMQAPSAQRLGALLHG
jgi:integrase